MKRSELKVGMEVAVRQKRWWRLPEKLLVAAVEPHRFSVGYKVEPDPNGGHGALVKTNNGATRIEPLTYLVPFDVAMKNFEAHRAATEANFAALARRRDNEALRGHWNHAVMKAAPALAHALMLVTGNAKLIPDPAMNGTTDCYSVPTDDIDAANHALMRWRECEELRAKIED